MSDVLKDKTQKREKKTNKAPSEGSHGVRGKEATVRTKELVYHPNSTLTLLTLFQYSVFVIIYHLSLISYIDANDFFY